MALRFLITLVGIHTFILLSVNISAVFYLNKGTGRASKVRSDFLRL